MARRRFIRPSNRRPSVIGDEVYEYRRPTPNAYFPTITAERERSTRLAIEGVAMAEKGWREVTAAWADLAGPAERHALDVFYLDRVVRADLAAMYLKAVIRRDPGCRDLLEALVGMVGALPPDVVVDARSVGDRLVRPTVALWWRLPRCRPAFASLVAAARPGSGPRGRAPRSRILRNPGLRLLGTGGWWVSPGSRSPGRRPPPRSPSSASIVGSGGSRSPEPRRASTGSVDGRRQGRGVAFGLGRGEAFAVGSGV